MNRKPIFLIILIISIQVLLIGCKHNDDTYTVWTSVDSYTDFQNVFGDSYVFCQEEVRLILSPALLFTHLKLLLQFLKFVHLME